MYIPAAAFGFEGDSRNVISHNMEEKSQQTEEKPEKMTAYHISLLQKYCKKCKKKKMMKRDNTHVHFTYGDLQC